MTNEEAIAIIENEKKCVNRANKNDNCNRDCYNCELVKTDTEILTALDLAIKALEQQPCEMTVEEYRHRMIQAFHNADTDELIAVCVLPTEKEFEHLEWLLKNHYKKAPCEDAISREAVCNIVNDIRDCISVEGYCAIIERLKKLPPVTPKSETVTEFADRCRECGKTRKGHWIWNFDKGYCKCSECGIGMGHKEFDYCPNCGAKMESEVQE